MLLHPKPERWMHDLFLMFRLFLNRQMTAYFSVCSDRRTA